MVITNDFLGTLDCSETKSALDDLISSPLPFQKQFAEFVLSIDIRDHYIPRWIRVAYLILSVKSQDIFKKMEVNTGDQFNKVVAKYLNAYITDGKMPPDDIATAILNLADEYMAGNVMNLRAGDYIAIHNHIRATGKSRI